MDRRREDAEHERHWRSLTKPMPALSAELPFHEEFTVEESARLQRCVLPGGMEDKWIVLLDDDYRLNFYRSWTGFHIYSVVLISIDADSDEPYAFCADDATVNRDPEQHEVGTDAFEAAKLRWLIRTLLLHQDVPMPQNPSVSGDEALLADWSFGGSAGFPMPEPEEEPKDEAPDEEQPAPKA